MSQVVELNSVSKYCGEDTETSVGLQKEKVPTGGGALRIKMDVVWSVIAIQANFLPDILYPGVQIR